MARDIFKINTLMCPLGIGNLHNNPQCRFHVAEDSAPSDGLCPVHKLALELTTDPADKIMITIIDPVEIETMTREDFSLARGADEKPVRRALTRGEKDSLNAQLVADTTRFNSIRSA